MNRDYHITMHDINRIRQIAEDEKVWLDENDTVSIKVWATWLQQAGASVILKDKIDAAPAGSGLSPDVFIFCIQTAFQKEQFNLIGKDFLGIDATHNTTQYVGLQLFTLIAQDCWGHGAHKLPFIQLLIQFPRQAYLSRGCCHHAVWKPQFSSF